MINQATRRKQRFTQISNSCLRDNRISWRAKGLMAYFMSHDETWIFRESKIVKDSTDGRDSVRTGLKELIEFGYLQKITQTRENGKFSHIDYYIDDEIEYSSKSQNNDVCTVDGKPDDGKPDDGKSLTKNKNNNNTNSKEEREEERKKKKEKPKIDFKFLAFIDDVRNFLRPRGNDYPALPTFKYGNIGLNNSNKLYSKRSGKELTAVQANEVFTTAYNSPVFVTSLKKYTDIG